MTKQRSVPWHTWVYTVTTPKSKYSKNQKLVCLAVSVVKPGCVLEFAQLVRARSVRDDQVAEMTALEVDHERTVPAVQKDPRTTPLAKRSARVMAKQRR